MELAGRNTARRFEAADTSKLQRAWFKYGEENFRFELLEETSVEQLAEREQFWLDSTKPFYNILKQARSTRGYKHTRETLERMSLMQRNRSPQHKQKLAEAKRGSIHTEESRRKMGLANKGRAASVSTRKKMSASRKGRTVVLQEQRNKIADALAKHYVFISPEGVRCSFKNLSAFCRERGLSQGVMSAVARGKRSHHKGWKMGA